MEAERIHDKKHCFYGMEAGSIQNEKMAFVRRKLNESRIRNKLLLGDGSWKYAG